MPSAVLPAKVVGVTRQSNCHLIARAIGDRASEQAALNNLGDIYRSLGQNEQAISYYDQSLFIILEIGDRAGKGRALINLGDVYSSLREYDRAANFYNQALTITEEIGDRAGESRALINLGDAYSSLGEYDQSANSYNQALTIAEEIGDRNIEAMSLSGLAVAYQALEQPSQAEAALDQASKLIWDLLGEETTSLDNLRSPLNTWVQTQRILPEILVAQDKPEEALRVSEESRHINWLLMTAMPTRHQPGSIFRNGQQPAPVLISDLQQIARNHQSTLVEYTVSAENLLIWVIQPDGTITHQASTLRRRSLDYSSRRHRAFSKHDDSRSTSASEY